MDFRTIKPSERDAVLDLLAHWLGDRKFFARYFEHDPTFLDDLCFVAADRGRIVSTLQVFRKRVRLRGAVVEVAGVGNVYTAEDYRDRRLASQLIRLAADAMEEHGFDLSLLFATRIPFYGRLGWQSHTRQLVFIDAGDVQPSTDRPIRPFEAGDLQAVMEIYDAYNADRVGTTVRDAAYWRGQLQYAGNPTEDFLVALDHGRVVAYARGTTLYDLYVIMEYGHLPGAEDALTDVIGALHGGSARNLPGTITQLAMSRDIQRRLAAQGLALRTVDDVFWMWRIVSVPRLAAKLQVDPGELDGDDVFFRLLPPATSVYWIADRF